MKKIAGYRVMLGLTQKQLSEILKISRQAYSEKERGNIPFKDNEKRILKDLLKKEIPTITIDELFFN